MNLENTKVYTTDPEVIRKYAELCGKPFFKQGFIETKGWFNGEHQSKIYDFVEFCDVDTCDRFTDITPDQINALYNEKFGAQNTNLMPCDPWDDVFVKFATGDLSVGDAGDFNWQNVTEWGVVKKMNTDQIAVTEQEDENLEAIIKQWKNGDACAYEGSDYIFVGMTPTFADVSCIIFSKENGIEHVSITALRKPETPQQREERERDEMAKQLMLDLCGDGAFAERDWEYHKKYTHTAKQCFKLVDAGYRKQ